MTERLIIDEPTKNVGLYEEPNQLLKLNESNNNGAITFENITNENFPAEIMRLDKDGMLYKGKRIEDAGEAHRLFVEVMIMMKQVYKEEKE